MVGSPLFRLLVPDAPLYRRTEADIPAAATFEHRARAIRTVTPGLQSPSLVSSHEEDEWRAGGADVGVLLDRVGDQRVAGARDRGPPSRNAVRRRAQRDGVGPPLGAGSRR